jgi:hypothetical protein
VCKETKPFEEFYVTLQSTCKVCQSARQVAYRRTVDGLLHDMLSGAKSHAKEREGEASIFDMTFEDLKDILEQQEGLCYYSKIKMTTHGQFKMSIERLDNDLGYVKSNVVLCCLEFNGQIKWTRDKVFQMLDILDQNIEENIVNFNRKGTIEYKDTPYDKNDYYQSARCKLKTLCVSSKHRVKKLNERGRNLEHDVDFDFLVNLFKEQKGLCAYSGLPLKFGNSKETDWVVSLERKDVNIGYIKENVCLICVEFNSTDNDAIKKHKTETSTGWSKEKFEVFVQTIRASIHN